MVDQDKIKEAVRLLLEGIGEDPDREGLAETPDRVARMYGELFSGMDADVAQPLSRVFSMENGGKGTPEGDILAGDMILEKDIVFHSMCEHHMLPFYGRAHIAYIPDGRVLGLSKLARTVEIYARRLQIQEQMTGQIADAIMAYLAPRGVMVVLEAEHMCMTMRGVKKPGSKTVTVAARGIFQEDALQERFFRMLGKCEGNH
ncbi:MAG: GTP cyclohydrolase I FolE [Lachnospiraceae bacterium]|jgi:GTP cyclohydrolase I|nr:GTP cyclohydrolase I FolE [uncultured Acetatifactor sp.]MCI9571114.1 GTP cyclohydrolase I FolE [Lachnospiraceae bacterium]